MREGDPGILSGRGIRVSQPLELVSWRTEPRASARKYSVVVSCCWAMRSTPPALERSRRVKIGIRSIREHLGQAAGHVKGVVSGGYTVVSLLQAFAEVIDLP